MNPTLCQLPTCRQRGRHLPACQEDDCGGCLPRLTIEGIVCHGCMDRAERLLAEIERLTPDARLVAAGQVRRGHGGTGGKPGSRSPANDDALDALDDALDQIARPAIRIAVRRGMSLHMPCIKSCVKPSPSQAHCSVCHQTWSGVSAFDRHRVDGRCRTPEEMGYARDDRGVYRAPMTEERRQQLAALRDSSRISEPQTAETPLVGVAPRADVSDGPYVALADLCMCSDHAEMHTHPDGGLGEPL